LIYALYVVCKALLITGWVAP